MNSTHTASRALSDRSATLPALRWRWFHVLPMVLMAIGSLPAAAETDRMLVIKDHRFEPAELRLPANERVKLVVHNQDATAEEFESHALNREKLVPAGARVTIYVGPLKPGRYDFVGEYHEATARGVVIAE